MAKGIRKQTLALLLSISAIVLHTACAQSASGNGPVYEEQMAIWPEDYDVLSDAILDEDIGAFQPPAVVPVVPVTTTTTSTSTTTTRRPVVQHQQHWFNTPTPRPTATATPTARPPPGAEAHVQIVHSAHVQHANGTTEDKLLLSNGVVDYKRTYQKRVAGQWVPVQEGYNAVPVRGQKGKYHTQFYIADENGNRVYKVTHGSRRPQLQHYWYYKGQKAQLSKHHHRPSQQREVAAVRME